MPPYCPRVAIISRQKKGGQTRWSHSTETRQPKELLQGWIFEIFDGYMENKQRESTKLDRKPMVSARFCINDLKRGIITLQGRRALLFCLFLVGRFFAFGFLPDAGGAGQVFLRVVARRGLAAGHHGLAAG